MSAQENSEVVRRYLQEVVGEGRIDVANEIVGEDLVFTSPYTPEPTRDRESFKQMIAGIHAAFPDFYLRQDQVLGRGRPRGLQVGGGRDAHGRTLWSAGSLRPRLPHHRDEQHLQGARWQNRGGMGNDDTLGMAAQLGLVGVPATVE